MYERLTRVASCAGGREFESQRPTISYTSLQTARHRFNIYAGNCLLPWRYNAEMGTANSLHASAKYGEYNERFGFGL